MNTVLFVNPGGFHKLAGYCWSLLLSYLVLLLKRKNKNHLWILWSSWSEKDYFLSCRGLKRVFVLEYLWLTVTKLCHAILENANAFSVHVTGFKHKIYRWLCFAKMRDLKVGRIKKEFKIVLFLSVLGNRDVWCVACLFAKLVFFCFSPSSLIVTSLYVNGSDEIDPLVVEQALLKCFKSSLKCRI